MKYKPAHPGLANVAPRRAYGSVHAMWFVGDRDPRLLVAGP
jgi:hypothetical protein